MPHQALSPQEQWVDEDDGPYIAASRWEVALILGLPAGALVALCLAGWYGMQALRAASGG